MAEQQDFIKLAIQAAAPVENEAKTFAMIAQAVELRRIADSLDALGTCVRYGEYFCVEVRPG